MNAITAQKEITALLLRRLGKIAPLAEGVACLPAVTGLSPNVSFVQPNSVDFIPFHIALYVKTLERSQRPNNIGNLRIQSTSFFYGCFVEMVISLESEMVVIDKVREIRILLV